MIGLPERGPLWNCARKPLEVKVAVSSDTDVFDRQLLRMRRRRAARLGPAAFLIDAVATELVDRLSLVQRRFDRVVDLGVGHDAVRRTLARLKSIGCLIAVDDGSDRSRDDRRGSSPATDRPAVIADEEALPFADGSLDLVVSALALQFVNDLPGVLVQIRRALKPDGLLLAALAGGDTLTELRQAFAAGEAEVEGGISPRVAPFVDVRLMGSLLQRAGFALPVTDVDRVTVRYASPLRLMEDLRRMGATNALLQRHRRPLRRATLKRVLDIYAERFSDGDGRVRATFDILWLSGWAPHESQQRPLSPGSARVRLADALGTAELPAGEEADPVGRPPKTQS